MSPRVRTGGGKPASALWFSYRSRRTEGLVSQKPNPFPKSIYDNIAYGLRVTGMKVDSMDDLVEQSLRGAALWDETKDKLKQSAYGLSGGQQQRLCIASGRIWRQPESAAVKR